VGLTTVELSDHESSEDNDSVESVVEKNKTSSLYHTCRQYKTHSNEEDNIQLLEWSLIPVIATDNLSLLHKLESSFKLIC